MLKGKRERTGHTGTMAYMVGLALPIPAKSQAPETLITDSTGSWRPSDSHADMWSLGKLQCG